ncbi:MAG: ATP-binding cassette domain-containing protein [candidate division Zixibacteria bacterium]|nr:ATP-binding cassette domain-containing protein [candidate division Zixibacteria bacterium]
MAGIQLKGLSKRFGKNVAIHPLDLKIDDGSFMAIVGPSGCGKSTLLNLIAGLETPSGGDIIFDGQSVLNLNPRKRDVAFVFQTYALYPHKTVYENIGFPLSIARVEKNEIDKRILEVAELLGLQNLLSRMPRELSGGQRQRVALGRAIIRQPKVFLLDEPLSNLDAKLRVQTRAELKKLHERLKTTFVYVTHDQTEAMSLADKIAILKDGKLHQSAPPREIYNNPADTFVGGFIGSPGMNFIKAAIDAEGREVAIENMLYPLSQPLEKSGDIIVGLRPEHFSIGEHANEKALAKEAVVVEPLGSETLIQTEISGAQVVIRAPADYNCEAGDPIQVTPLIENANFFHPETGVNIELMD